MAYYGQFLRLRSALYKSKVLAFDLETEGGPVLGEDGNQIPGAKGDARDIYTNIPTHFSAASGSEVVVIRWGRAAESFVREVLYSPDYTVVVHNALFDILTLHYKGLIDVEKIRATLWDSMVMLKVLDGELPADLKSSVRRMLGIRMTTYEEARLTNPTLQRLADLEREIEELWRHHYTRVPIELRKAAKAYRRCAKEKIKRRYFKQRGAAAAKQFELTVLERVVEARFGAPALESLRRKTADLVSRYEAEIAGLSRKAELIFTEYAADDARYTLKLARKAHSAVRKAHGKSVIKWLDVVEQGCRQISLRMSARGSYIDKPKLKDLAESARPLETEMLARCHDIAKDGFNPNSPQQVARIIYDLLNLEPPPGSIRPDKRTGKINERPTKSSVLSRIPHPIGQAILNYRTVVKQLQFMDKILSSLDPRGRVHTTYNSVQAKTLRWSSSKPLNLQNIPSRKKGKEFDDRIQELGVRIRESFIAPPGRALVVIDLSQIELRELAHFCDDDAMIRTFNQSVVVNGTRFFTGDLHLETQNAILIDGKPIPRKLAKNVNFGFAYGARELTFAEQVRLMMADDPTAYDLELAERLRNGWFEKYQGVDATLRKLTWYINNQDLRTFPMISGRVRTFHGVKRRPDGSAQLAAGKALNTVIQGSAADILKLQSYMTEKHVERDQKYRGLAELIMQVHDELLLDVDIDVAVEVAERVKVIMEYPWFNLAVPILASCKVCKSWADKDDDAVPEIGMAFGRTKTGEDLVFDESSWGEYQRRDKAGEFALKSAASSLSTRRAAPHLEVLSQYAEYLPLFSPTRQMFPRPRRREDDDD